MSAIDVEVGRVIRFLRRQRDLGQDVLAEAIGVTRGAVSNLESGRQVWLLDRIVSAAVVLGTTAEAIVAEAQGALASGSAGDASESDPPGLSDVAIGTRVRDIRSARGMSQSSLACKMDTTQIRVSRLELGRQRWLADHVVRVARALNVSAQVILGEPSEHPLSPVELSILDAFRGATDLDAMNAFVAALNARAAQSQGEGGTHGRHND